MSQQSALRDIAAAGAVVTRSGKQVLLVHRPKYDDWSFPKGKLDRGEHATAGAVREVAEETGLTIRLGPPLQAQRYAVGTRMKTVQYWVARVSGDDDVAAYQRNEEIDDVAWVPIADAYDRLTYPHDRATLRESVAVRKKTRTTIVLRHAKARSRTAWRGNDRNRPLLALGERQADLVAPVLAAYGVRRLVSSSSLRCLQTLAPYAALSATRIEGFDQLSEEDAGEPEVAKLVGELMQEKPATVLCGHRPVLPMIFAAMGLEPVRLEPGSMLVVHHRKGAVVATERHPA